MFAKNNTDLERANIPPYQINVTSDEPITLPSRKLGPKEREELHRQVKVLLTRLMLSKIAKASLQLPVF